MSKYKHEVILCIVNSGFSDEVMDAAKEFGAKGGTVIRARGTANAEAEKLFNIAIQPEKEIVMILVESKIKNDILHALYRAVGLNTPGQGIAFTVPVESVVGLTDFSAEAKSNTDSSEA
ncbi:MAG: P-II family nitrogen regulator [Clostridia bacterium]|nr:P-II family nitrogen regulator [Clostridia bacterium]